MKPVKIIPSKHWRNVKTGMTASIYGSCPWYSDTEKADWELVTVGWTFLNDNGTVGNGHIPYATMEAAQAMFDKLTA